MPLSDLTPSEALDEALHGEDPARREAALAFLLAHADAALVKQLIGLLEAPRRVARRRAERILWELPVGRTRAALVRTTHNRSGAHSSRARAVAARLLAAQSPGDEELALSVLDDPSPRVRRAILGPATPAAVLARALLDPDRAVAERAAELICDAGSLAALDPDLVRRALPAHRPPPEPLLRLLAALDPTSPELAERALAGDPTALDHLADRGALCTLLATDHRIAAVWGLARAQGIDGDLGRELAADADPRVRAALARALAPADDLLPTLLADPDPGVAWLAARARGGELDAARMAQRHGSHPRAADRSATPPYGLREGPPSAPALPPRRLHAALALCQPRLDVNLGVAARSADAAGLSRLFLVGRGDLQRAASRGVEQVLPITALADSRALLRAAREGDHQIVAIQQTPASIPYHRAPYPPRPLFVAGAEAEGLPALLRAEADLLVDIPQFGAIDSLNVAAAVTAVLFQWRMGVEDGLGAGEGRGC